MQLQSIKIAIFYWSDINRVLKPFISNKRKSKRVNVLHDSLTYFHLSRSRSYFICHPFGGKEIVLLSASENRFAKLELHVCPFLQENGNNRQTILNQVLQQKL